MNEHLLFEEQKELNKKWNQMKHQNFNLLKNQLKIAKQTGLELEQVVVGNFDSVDERTTAEKINLGYTTEDGTEKQVITLDYLLDDFTELTVFTEKDDINLEVRVLASLETNGEFFQELTKIDQTGTQETFFLQTKPATRVRLKFIIDKVEDTGAGSLLNFDLITQ